MSDRAIKIYCPKCTWMPVPSSRWRCSCACAWNTFDTGGVCPKCGKAWTETQCLSCQQWSPNQAWYHQFIDGNLVVEKEPEPAREGANSGEA